MQGLLQRLKPKFQVNYHSYGKLLLYTFGWQVQTPSADDPIFVALSGNRRRIRRSPDTTPASAPTCTRPTARRPTTRTPRRRRSRWTPELGEGVRRQRLRLPRRRGAHPGGVPEEPAVRARRRQVGAEPGQPVSHLGKTTKPFYLDMSEIDPEKRNNPLSDFRFAVSYGDPQPVQVLARRSLGAVTLKYQINGGAESGAPDVRVERRRAVRRARRRLLPRSCAAASPARSRATS